MYCCLLQSHFVFEYFFKCSPSLRCLPLCTLPHSPFCTSLSGSLCRLLLELLELLFDKFKAVAQAHSVVLAHMQQIAAHTPGVTHEERIKLYEQADVSAKIQAVLQVSFLQQSKEKHVTNIIICAGSN